MSKRIFLLECIVIITLLVLAPAGALATPAHAPRAGSALQFNGTNQYVTFGRAVGTTGTINNYATAMWTTNSPFGSGRALLFNGSNQYVTFGQAPELGLSSFTIEVWFYRTGTGVGTDTSAVGGGGLQGAIPLLTKGRGEADGSDVDMNYFLGIASNGRLAVDFEEGAGGANPGLNHAITGTTTIANNVWYHAAATYDGTNLRLYLNGNLEGSLTLGTSTPPRADSRQHAGLATALNSSGTAAGFFAGILDEARIWNYARSQADIQNTMNQTLTRAPGLVGRWSMDEGAGNVVCDSAKGLGTFTFTLETWFYWTGAGATTSTGTGGITAIPLMTKGRGEEDGTNKDMNYFLGIEPTTRRLVADFEEGAGQPSPGLNQPITGTTSISTNTWHHVAATFDGNAWSLYLDGTLDATRTVGRLPRADSIQYAALASALTSTGAAQGYFAGILDEARIWNYARSQTEIQNAMALEITSAPGLIGRWAMDEGSGVSVGDSSGSNITGTAQNNPSWVAGVTFAPPAAPTSLTATAAGNQISLAWTDNSNNELSFEIERSTTGGGGPFTSLASVPANTTTYSNTGLAFLTEYCYRVRATNRMGNSTYSNVACTTTQSEPNNAIQFGNNNAYVTFGAGTGLNASTFTIETWFRRDGTGVSVTTGTGGIPDAIPLVTKGTSEQEAANLDINYFLCIRASDNVLCADFEEGPSGASPSLNHPVAGVTPISNGVWYHAAATYDGTRWRLYLNGNLEAELEVGQPPASTTNSAAALGTSIRSTDTAQGFFNGALDEVRIWNYARTQDQIKSTINTPITTPQSGLLGRWSLNEGTGTVVNGSAGTTFNGTLTGSGWSWVSGAPFNLNIAPFSPTDNIPANGATNVSLSPTLSVLASDPNADNLTVTFYGRQVPAPVPDFTLIALPDTQYYSLSYPQIFSAQTQWIVDNRTAMNVVFVTHLGDITENGDNDTDDSEWINADNAITLLEQAGIPFGLEVGNHDQLGGTTRYNNHFGISRFTGRSYYGGNYGTNNNNHYELFSAGNLNFIIVHLENSTDSNPDQPVLLWTDNLLQTYSDRRAIVIVHNLLDSSNNFSTQGNAVYQALRDRPNLFLMMGGHLDTEGRRQDTGTDGHVIYSLRSDYQTRANGGNGWLRILEFSPANNLIRVRTYSPTLNQYETDADSQFTLPYNMQSNGFQVIGTVNVSGRAPVRTPRAPADTASVVWQNLNGNTTYEWYVTVSDGTYTTTSSVWRFSTERPTVVNLASFVAYSSAWASWIALLGLAGASSVILSLIWLKGQRS